VYAANPSQWKDSFAAIDGLEKHITSDTPLTVASYITEEDKEHHRTTFGSDYSSCVNWYKRGIQNLGVEEEIKSLKEGEIQDRIPENVQALMITGSKDAVCLAGWAEQAMRGVCREGQLAISHLDAGHWIMMEKSEEVNAVLENFVAGGVEAVKGKRGRAVL